MNGRRYVYKAILCLVFIFFTFHQSVFSKNRGIRKPLFECWLITSLQCLSHVSSLNDFFYRHEKDFKPGSMARLYVSTLQELQKADPSPVVVTGDVRALFDKIKTTFVPGRQEEFNDVYPEGTNLIYDRDSFKKSVYGDQQEGIIAEYDNLLVSKVTSNFICKVNNTHITRLEERRTMIVVGTSALQETINKDYRSDSERLGWWCRWCNRYVTVILRPSMTYASPVIHVRLSGIPSMMAVPFPLTALVFGNKHYSLKSFAVNAGPEVHWYAYGRDTDGHWYRYDDSRVTGPVDDVVANIALGNKDSNVTGYGRGVATDFFYEDEAFLPVPVSFGPVPGPVARAPALPVRVPWSVPVAEAPDFSVRAPDSVIKKIVPEKTKLVQLKDSLLRLKEKLGVLSGRLRDLKKAKMIRRLLASRVSFSCLPKQSFFQLDFLKDTQDDTLA